MAAAVSYSAIGRAFIAWAHCLQRLVILGAKCRNILDVQSDDQPAPLDLIR